MKQDLIYALRLLASRPWHTALTLAVLFIGMSTTLGTYSLVNIIGFKPLDLPRAESLVVVDLEEDGDRDNDADLDPFDVIDFKQQQQVLDKVGSYLETYTNFVFNNESMSLLGVKADPQFFEAVGVAPLLGRSILEGDLSPNAAPVAVLSYNLWKSQFGGDDEVLGTMIRVGGKETQIVGIMPQHYGFPRATEIWLPLDIDYSQLTRGQWGFLALVGHLKPGISLEEANKNSEAIAKRLENQYPASNDGKSIFIERLKPYYMSNSMVMMRAMLFSVFVVLAIACANVGGLLLARMGERQQEIAVRMALGANRKRIILQMMLESFILTTLGGVFSLMFVIWFLDLMTPVFAGITDHVFFWWQFKLDAETIWASIGIVLLTTVVSSLYPAIKASSTNFNEILKSGTRGAESKSSGRLMKVLVTVEIGLSCGLVLVSSLLVLSNFVHSQTDYGVDTQPIISGQYRWPAHIKIPEERAAIMDSLKQEMLKISGVQGVSFATTMPSRSTRWAPFHDEGEVYDKPKQYRKGLLGMVDDDYFKTFDVAFIAGRAPNALDDHSETSKVVVTQSFADQWWPGENPLGKRFILGTPQQKNEKSLEVLGVIPHLMMSEPNRERRTMGTVFVNHNRANELTWRFFVRTEGDMNAIMKKIRRAFFQVEPELSVLDLETLDEQIEMRQSGMGLISDFFGIYGLSALVLALTGIYGIMSLSIQQKTQEIGIRRALGALDKTIKWWLIRSGTWPLVVGLALGLSMGGSLVFILINQFNTIAVWIPVVFLAVSLFVISIVLLAISIPAGKALSTEPINALRNE